MKAKKALVSFQKTNSYTVYRFVSGYCTYVGESPLTCLPNSSQETAPIGTNDIPLDLYGHVDPAHGMHFPDFIAILE